MKGALASASRWSWRGMTRSLTIAAVALSTGAALGYVIAHEKVPQQGASTAAPPRPGASQAELALLAPLREGSALAGFDVAEIRPVGDDGDLEVICRREHATVRLKVFLAASGSPSPPATAGRYAIFYSLENAAVEEGERLATALATVVAANAATPPPRLRVFTPQSR